MPLSTVSVIIPTYQRNDYLRRALESIQHQSYPQNKIDTFVVDGADENAKNVAEEFGAQYQSPTPDPGIAGCRQAAIDEADSEYVHLLDDDDTLTKSAIETQVNISNATDSGVTYGAVKWPTGRVVRPNSDVQGDVLWEALAFEMAPCIPSTMLIEKEILEQLPRLETLPSDDVAFNIELAQVAEYAYTDSVVVNRQSGETGVGGNKQTVENRRMTIDKYQNLYEQYPDAYRRARAATDLLAAQAAFGKRFWSPRAILYGFRGARYAPSIATVGYAVATLFGRPGRDFARNIYSNYLLSEESEGKIW